MGNCLLRRNSAGSVNNSELCIRDTSTQTVCDNESMLCSICLEREVSIIVYPCFHFCVCYLCGAKLKHYSKERRNTTINCIHGRKISDNRVIRCPICARRGCLFKVFYN